MKVMVEWCGALSRCLATVLSLSGGACAASASGAADSPGPAPCGSRKVETVTPVTQRSPSPPASSTVLCSDISSSTEWQFHTYTCKCIMIPW